MDRNVHTGTAYCGQRSPKLHRVVFREAELTVEQIVHRYGPTLSDWTPQEQAAFTRAVTDSHGWNYHNMMAVTHGHPA